MGNIQFTPRNECLLFTVATEQQSNESRPTVCLSRGDCFEEEACVCACRPSGQRGHSFVGHQADSQKQNDAAAPHIRGVGRSLRHKHLVLTTLSKHFFNATH